MHTDTALKFALAPLLIAQGLGVRRRALVLPEAAGPRTGVSGEGAPLRLLVVGDSSAAGVGAPSQDLALTGHLLHALSDRYRVSWRLIARTGDTTAHALARLAEEDPAPFDIALTALGVNDVTHAVPLARWLHRQAALRERLANRFSVRHVVVSGLPPMAAFPALPQPLRMVMGQTARRFDRALSAALDSVPTATHVAADLPLGPGLMAADGFHPSPAGYAIWAGLLAPAIVAAAEKPC